MRRKHLARIVAAVVAVLSALVVLASFGVKLPQQPFAPIPLDGPTAIDSNGSITAIADRESRRILILNDDCHLTGMVSCESLNSPIEAVTDVCVSNDEVYVAGVKYEKDSDTIVQERVVAYDTHGLAHGVVYESPETSSQTATIKTLCDSDDEGVLVGVLRENIEDKNTNASNNMLVQVILASRRESKIIAQEATSWMSVFDMAYDVLHHNYATISQRGLIDDDLSDAQSLDSADYVFTSIDLSDKGQAYAYDDVSKAICRIEDDGEMQRVIEGSGYSDIHVNKDRLSACNRESNYVIVSDLDGTQVKQIGSVTPSAALNTYISLIWVCRLYLVAVAIVFLVQKVRGLIAAEKYEGIGPMFASVTVVLAMSLAIGFISRGTYNALHETRAKEINTFADYIAAIAPNLSESMELYNDRNAIRSSGEAFTQVTEGLMDIIQYLYTLSLSATNNGIGTYVVVYGKDDQGVFYAYDGTDEHIMGTGNISATNREDIERIFDTNTQNGEMSTGRTVYDATQYRLVRVPSADGTRTVGVIEIGSHVRTFESSIVGSELQRIIALLVLILVIYLTYSEIRACSECFVTFSHIQQEQTHNALAILARPFSFCVTILSSIDGVMTTLIARSLLWSVTTSDKSLLLALPAVMMGIGLALGQGIYGRLGPHVPLRKLVVRGALGVMAGASFAAVVVWMESFWLYCLAKLLMAVPFGLLYTLSYSLPRKARSAEMGAMAAAGIKRTDTSAAALGTVLGGYAAQMLGNAWVYVIVAATSIPTLLMASNLFPRGSKPLESKDEDEDHMPYRAVILRLIRGKTTVPIIFFAMLPAIFAAGYNSFLFPLFSADAGLDTSSINNMFVLGQLVVYVLISPLEVVEERYDKWRVTVLAVCMLGCVFLLFSLNATLVWAIVSIVLVGVLCKAADGWKTLWMRSATACEVSPAVTAGIMFATRSVLLVVQPLLLGLLLTASDRVATIVLGLLCVTCGIAFYATTHNSALAPAK